MRGLCVSSWGLGLLIGLIYGVLPEEIGERNENLICTEMKLGIRTLKAEFRDLDRVFVAVVARFTSCFVRLKFVFVDTFTFWRVFCLYLCLLTFIAKLCYRSDVKESPFIWPQTWPLTFKWTPSIVLSCEEGELFHVLLSGRCVSWPLLSRCLM
jgi:hypothetical protein